jgi:hypothetical protein
LDYSSQISWGQYYTITAADGGWDVVQSKFGISTSQLVLLNPNLSCLILKVGQQICLSNAPQVKVVQQPKTTTTIKKMTTTTIKKKTTTTTKRKTTSTTTTKKIKTTTAIIKKKVEKTLKISNQ